MDLEQFKEGDAVIVNGDIRAVFLKYDAPLVLTRIGDKGHVFATRAAFEAEGLDPDAEPQGDNPVPISLLESIEKA